MRNVAPLLLLKTALPRCKLVPLRFAALPLSVSSSLALFIRGRSDCDEEKGAPPFENSTQETTAAAAVAVGRWRAAWLVHKTTHTIPNATRGESRISLESTPVDAS